MGGGGGEGEVGSGKMNLIEKEVIWNTKGKKEEEKGKKRKPIDEMFFINIYFFYKYDSYLYLHISQHKIWILQCLYRVLLHTIQYLYLYSSK